MRRLCFLLAIGFYCITQITSIYATPSSYPNIPPPPKTPNMTTKHVAFGVVGALAIIAGLFVVSSHQGKTYSPPPP